jgi:hypothetical protein
MATAAVGQAAYDRCTVSQLPMTSEQAAQLIDHTLALVHDRLQQLQPHGPEQRALAAEFREWAEPTGGCIDLMLCPGTASP